MEANSYNQLKMTDHVSWNMTNLYFEDDRPLDTKPCIASKQFGQLRQVHQPWLAMLALAGTPPSLASRLPLLSRSY